MSDSNQATNNGCAVLLISMSCGIGFGMLYKSEGIGFISFAASFALFYVIILSMESK